MSLVFVSTQYFLEIQDQVEGTYSSGSLEINLSVLDRNNNLATGRTEEDLLESHLIT